MAGIRANGPNAEARVCTNGLGVFRLASFQVLNSTGERPQPVLDVYHPWLYSVHGARVRNGNIVILSSGFNLIFEYDIVADKVVWEWRSHWHGMGNATELEQLCNKDPDKWYMSHCTGEAEMYGRPDGAIHLNSLRFLSGDIVLCSALLTGQIFIFDVNVGNPTVLFESKEHGVHCPFFLNSGRLAYGCSTGIYVEGTQKVEAECVKSIEPLGSDGYVAACNNEVIVLDDKLNVQERFSMFKPFSIVVDKLEL
jgi:hypothetical protein